MILGAYSLHLYCDNPACKTERPYSSEKGYGPHAEYVHEKGSVCRRRARRAGWNLNLRDGRAICPACVRAGWTENQ